MKTDKLIFPKIFSCRYIIFQDFEGNFQDSQNFTLSILSKKKHPCCFHSATLERELSYPDRQKVMIIPLESLKKFLVRVY